MVFCEISRDFANVIDGQGRELYNCGKSGKRTLIVITGGDIVKRLLSLMLAALCIGLGLLGMEAQAAESGTFGSGLSWSLTDEGVLTVSGVGEMPDFTALRQIPWNEQQEKVRAVIVEDGITDLGKNAFIYCSNLAEISLASSVNSIGDYSFYGCSSLEKVEIPGGVETLGKYAFANGGLKEVTLNEGLTTIEEGAFSYCTALAGVAIPDSVTAIGDSAFESCYGLTEFAFPGKVTVISSSIS